MRYDLGLILTPRSNRATDATSAYRVWAADSGIYARPAAFDLCRYLAWLAGLPNRAACRFATAPDVVGDAAATWQRSKDILPTIRALGYPAALVAQDGIERMRVDWSALDVLFVGGTTAWKRSHAAYALIGEARARGVPVHVGRVNSWVRLVAFAGAGADSADGTLLRREDKYLPRLLRWLDALGRQPALWDGAPL